MLLFWLSPQLTMVSLGQLSTPCRGSSRGAVVLGGQGVCEAREPPLSFWHAALCESQSILSHFCATSKAHVHQLSVCMPPAVILASAHARDARGRGPVLISSALLRTCTHTRCGQTAGMVPMVGVLGRIYGSKARKMSKFLKDEVPQVYPRAALAPCIHAWRAHGARAGLHVSYQCSTALCSLQQVRA